MLVALLLKTTMKLCKDCRNYNDKDSMCLLGWASPVNGQKTRVYATYARNYEVYCGANAIKFDEKEPPMPELLPCLHCGGDAFIGTNGRYQVRCKSCKMETAEMTDLRDAVFTWNRSVK